MPGSAVVELVGGWFWDWASMNVLFVGSTVLPMSE